MIIFDDGYSHGRGAFETIKIIGQNPEFLDEHISRLNSSLRFFSIDKTIHADEINTYIRDNNIEDCALNIFVSEKNTILKSRQDPYTKSDKSKLFKGTISSVRRNSTSKLLAHKSFNYMENIMEKSLAKDRGFDEVLFVNEKGNLAEGAVSNIFFSKAGKLYTPTKEAGLLNGVIRQFIINNFDVIETRIGLEDLKYFESSFITNSLMGLRELEEIDGVKFTNSKEVEAIKEVFIKRGY